LIHDFRAYSDKVNYVFEGGKFPSRGKGQSWGGGDFLGHRGQYGGGVYSSLFKINIADLTPDKYGGDLS
jgi:hypothetical protein